MSKRNDEREMHHIKGSSRSRDRDHYRKHREDDGNKYTPKHDVSRERSRSREKGHKWRHDKETTYSKTKSSPAHSVPTELEDIKVREMSISPQREEEEVPPPPPPPRISKICIGFNKPIPTVAPTIKMNLGGFKCQPLPKKTPIASVFSADDDDEPEEMPAEARMRMRNIGRETPTSAGPNSFGKTKQGFCDSKKIFEKNLKAAMDDVGHQKTSVSKLPNNIYKL